MVLPRVSNDSCTAWSHVTSQRKATTDATSFFAPNTLVRRMRLTIYHHQQEKPTYRRFDRTSQDMRDQANTSKSTTSDKQIASSERLQKRLDEASLNKAANRRMEDRDKAPPTAADTADQNSASSRTHSSSRRRSASSLVATASSAGQRRAGHSGGQIEEKSCREPPTDRGEYYIRRYRKEVRTAYGTAILEVKEYAYFPPRRGRSA